VHESEYLTERTKRIQRLLKELLAKVKRFVKIRKLQVNSAQIIQKSPFYTAEKCGFEKK
jgi:hypothetical protein